MEPLKSRFEKVEKERNALIDAVRAVCGGQLDKSAQEFP
jgi:hypothetical protein